MTRSELKSVIGAVLREKMSMPQLAELDEAARLNEELGLDSVMVLELLVHLELEHGLALPEEAVLRKQDGNLGSLLDFLLEQRP
jgi:aryl carrier protein AsbD